jgi:hypothetical protein
MKGNRMTLDISTAKADLAALDLSEYNNRIATIEAERARIADAIDRADAHRQEMTHELQAPLETATRGMVADALLANASPSEAAQKATDHARIYKERQDLTQGVLELRRRHDALGQDIAAVQREAGTAAGIELMPLIDEIMAEARDAGERILAAYASIAAINAITRSAADITDTFGQAVVALAEKGFPVATRAAVTVPGEIAEALRPLKDKGPAISFTLLEMVPLPANHATVAAFSAGLRAGAASR